MEVDESIPREVFCNMSLHSEWLTFTKEGQSYKMYTSRPEVAKTPLPVVIVIQEIWGVDAHIAELTDRFAKAGYLAVAPDIYAENGVRPEVLSEQRIEQVKNFLNSTPPAVWHDEAARQAELNKLPEQQRDEIQTTFTTLFGGLARGPVFLQILQATFNYLHDDYEVSRGQKIASTGYCMGGALSVALASAEPRLAGAATYYGMLPNTQDKVETIGCPVYGFYGSFDERINAGIPGFNDLMQAAGNSFRYEIYEGAHHAFFNETRPTYNVDAARDAWVKTLAFFKDVLI